ncbi:hypothetical protein B0H13DRAFT_2275009 [Mycena leptocephala]|nr:hypothetical protein B0H13DRAFT_2275009 [Mycena leptocephala]
MIRAFPWHNSEAFLPTSVNALRVKSKSQGAAPVINTREEWVGFMRRIRVGAAAASSRSRDSPVSCVAINQPRVHPVAEIKHRQDSSKHRTRLEQKQGPSPRNINFKFQALSSPSPAFNVDPSLKPIKNIARSRYSRIAKLQVIPFKT